MADNQKQAKEAAGKCGHVNEHYIPSEGSGIKKMTCTLPAGHAPVGVRREMRDDKGKLFETFTSEVVHSAPYKMFKEGKWKESTAFWTDGAGVKRPSELMEKHA